MFSLLLTLGFAFYGGKRMSDSINSFANNILFKRTNTLNLTNSRKKNIITYKNHKSIYLYSINPEYKRTILYLHGSGGSIHDREFICIFFDLINDFLFIFRDYTVFQCNIF